METSQTPSSTAPAAVPARRLHIETVLVLGLTSAFLWYLTAGLSGLAAIYLAPLVVPCALLYQVGWHGYSSARQVLNEMAAPAPSCWRARWPLVIRLTIAAGALLIGTLGPVVVLRECIVPAIPEIVEVSKLARQLEGVKPLQP